MNKEFEMIALLSKSEDVIRGLIMLLNMPGRSQDSKGIEWWHTGHGQIAEKVLKEIQDFKGRNI